MGEFRKITAKDPMYKKIREEFTIELDRFEEFLKRETESSKSGKPSSYKGYLIRFLVHLKEIFDESVIQLESMKAVEQIDRITKTSSFREKQICLSLSLF